MADGKKMHIIWVQGKHTAGDQSFEPHILVSKNRTQLITSHRQDVRATKLRNDDSTAAASSGKRRTSRLLKSLKKVGGTRTEWLTINAALIGILGFIVQFQGLRFSNWSRSVGQLIAMAITSLLRAVVRRGMMTRPVSVQVLDEHELDWLALSIVGSGSKFPDDEDLKSLDLSFEFGACPVQAITQAQPSPACDNPQFEKQSSSTVESDAEARNTPQNNPGAQSAARNVATDRRSPPTPRIAPASQKAFDSRAHRAMKMRAHLGKITESKGPKAQEALNLTSLIEAAIRIFEPDLVEADGPQTPAERQGKDRMVWIKVRTDPEGPLEDLGFTLQHCAEPGKDGLRWRLNASEIQAALSLATFCIRKGQDNATESQSRMHESNSMDWLRAATSNSSPCRRILGKWDTLIEADLRMWTKDLNAEYLKLKFDSPKSLSHETPGRVLGFYHDLTGG